jgi:hypothetical protein
METDPVYKTLHSLFFRMLNDDKVKKSGNLECHTALSEPLEDVSQIKNFLNQSYERQVLLVMNICILILNLTYIFLDLFTAS